MSDQEDEGVPLDHAQQMVELVFRALVENGEIEIGDRSPEEICEQFDEIINDVIDSGGLRAGRDYRETLLDRARAEVEVSHDELATTLYAIWIEHFINGMLIRTFERMGHDTEVSTPLLRGLSLQVKAYALWAVVGLPPIDEESRRLLDRIVQFRNAFVHYKWIAHEDLAFDNLRRSQLKEVLAQSERLVADLLKVESSAFWNGRDKELIGNFREHLRRRRS